MATSKTTTTDSVLAALGDQPATTAELAETTGLGRSTVGKTLTALETAGRATRTLGGRDGGRKQPDRWTLATTEAAPPGDGTAGNGGAERLGKGQLRTLVLDHLQASPGEDHSPTQVAKALGGRSSGAVGNALLKLAADGVVTQTSEKPRRFTYAR